MKPEDGPLQLYNWAEYVNPAVIKSFEKYGVEVELSTFSTIDEAVAKLASGAVGFDVFVPTQPYISLLVAGKILQPLNLSYVPNLRANVWPSLHNPWYDVGSRYTVPYTVYTTGIGWRNDFLPDYDPSKLPTHTRASGRPPTSPAASGCSTTSAKGSPWRCSATGSPTSTPTTRRTLDGASEALRN